MLPTHTHTINQFAVARLLLHIARAFQLKSLSSYPSLANMSGGEKGNSISVEEGDNSYVNNKQSGNNQRNRDQKGSSSHNNGSHKSNSSYIAIPELDDELIFPIDDLEADDESGYGN
ncbi:hypothetical protein GGS26DRAFT_552144, partial [Hypomontagnella submonticulosa]